MEPLPAFTQSLTLPRESYRIKEPKGSLEESLRVYELPVKEPL
jgi:hypothetical protein